MIARATRHGLFDTDGDLMDSSGDEYVALLALCWMTASIPRTFVRPDRCRGSV